MRLSYSERRRLLDRALLGHVDKIHGTILEVGAGRNPRRGRFVPPGERTTSWWSLDLAPEARPHLVGDVEALPLRAASVDTVVSLEVLEYVLRPDLGLSEIHRVLRPGGHLLVSVPFVHRMDSPSDRWRFSEHGLRAALRSAGFEIIALQAQGYVFTAIAHLLWSAVAQCPSRAHRWFTGALALPVVGLARLEPLLVRPTGPLSSATTGYLALARK